MARFRGAPNFPGHGNSDEFFSWGALGCVIIMVNVLWVAIDQYPHWTVLHSHDESPGTKKDTENDLRENPIATVVGAAIFSIPMLSVLCGGVVVLPEGMFDNKRSAFICFSVALVILVVVDLVVLLFAVVAEPCYALIALASTLSMLPLATATVRHIQISLDKMVVEAITENQHLTEKTDPVAASNPVTTIIKALEAPAPSEEKEGNVRTGEETSMDITLPNGVTQLDKDRNVAEDQTFAEGNAVAEDKNVAEGNNVVEDNSLAPF